MSIAIVTALLGGLFLLGNTLLEAVTREQPRPDCAEYVRLLSDLEQRYTPKQLGAAIDAADFGDADDACGDPHEIVSGLDS